MGKSKNTAGLIVYQHQKHQEQIDQSIRVPKTKLCQYCIGSGIMGYNKDSEAIPCLHCEGTGIVTVENNGN